MKPLDDDDLLVLSREAVVEERISRLLQYVAGLLVGEIKRPAYELDADSKAPNGARRIWVIIDPPNATWLANQLEGGMSVMITGAAYGEERAVGTPYVYAGVEWKAGREGRSAILGSTWEKSATKAALGIYWEDPYCSVYAGRPLRETIEMADTLADQAAALAEWAHRSILTVLRLRPPPDPDRKRFRTRKGAA